MESLRRFFCATERATSSFFTPLASDVAVGTVRVEADIDAVVLSLDFLESASDLDDEEEEAQEEEEEDDDDEEE
jgi:hypothetical protein